MKRPRSIGSLLLIAACAVFLLLILVETAGEIREEEAGLLDAAQRDILIDAARLSLLVERAGRSNAPLVQEAVAESATDERLAFALIVTPADRIWFSSRIAWLDLPVAAVLTDRQRQWLMLARQAGAARLYRDDDGNRVLAMLHYHAPTGDTATLGEAMRGVVVVVYDLRTRIAAARETALFSRIPVGVLLIVLLLTALLLLFRFVTRPLATLREAARRVAAGDFSIHLDESGPLEIRDLSRAFNGMTGRIGELLGRQARQSEDLRRALAERDLLLREVHHRVKNNLQIVASLLHVHARRLCHEDDMRVFEDIRDRLRTMTLVHNQLYQAGDLSRVDAVEYVRVLFDEVVRSHASPGLASRLEIDAEPVWLPADIALPLGMLLNELVLNALKHASPDGRPVRVLAALHRTGETLVLRVEDDGVGMPASDGPSADSPSFGMKLVRALAAQIGATLTCHDGLGTQVEVVLPLREPAINESSRLGKTA